MKKMMLLIALVGGVCAHSLSSFAQNVVTMPVLKVTMSEPIMKHMEYCTGSCELTDESGNVVRSYAKVKTRGATAQQYLMKPSLNLKFYSDSACTTKADVSMLGLREDSKYILDAMAIDRICMRNRVAMDIWNAYSPLPYDTKYNQRSGTEGRFLEVYINGAYKGIYCMSDEINRKLLNLEKYKKGIKGILYKSGTSDIEDQNNRNFTDDYLAATISWHNAWELKYPDDYVDDHADEAAWQPLIDLYDNCQSYSSAKGYFYMDNLVDYQLLIMALSIGDNFGNKNHFFSIRDASQDINDADTTKANMRKVIVSPWDLDTSLGGKYNGSNYDGTYSKWKVKDVAKSGFYPFNLFHGQSEYKAALKARWAEVRSTAFSVDNVNKRLDTYRDLFINSGAWKRMVDYWNSASGSKPLYVDDLDKELTYIKQWYAARVAEMDAYFGIDGTGIENVNVDCHVTEDNNIYNLQGQRLKVVPAKGIYIINGKKYAK